MGQGVVVSCHSVSNLDETFKVFDVAAGKFTKVTNQNEGEIHTSERLTSDLYLLSVETKSECMTFRLEKGTGMYILANDKLKIRKEFAQGSDNTYTGESFWLTFQRYGN